MKSYLPLLLLVAAGGEVGISEDQLTPENVKQLSSCDLIRIEQDLRDRVFMVVLTEKGRELLDER